MAALPGVRSLCRVSARDRTARLPGGRDSTGDLGGSGEVLREALQVCPVAGLEAPRKPQGCEEKLFQDFGPVLEIWEGHATDPEIRYRGSSGGALTAISLYCLERLGWYGVLHTGADSEEPVRNRTRLSRSRAELLAGTGSRYSPASVCDGLGLLANAPAPCVLVGKPVEVAAARKAVHVWPEVERNLGLLLSFFAPKRPVHKQRCNYWHGSVCTRGR